MSKKKPVIGKDLEGPEMPLDILWREVNQTFLDCQRAELHLAITMRDMLGLDSPLLHAAQPTRRAEVPQGQQPLFGIDGGAA